MSVYVSVQISGDDLQEDDLRELLDDYGDFDSIITVEEAARCLRDRDREAAIEAMADYWCTSGVAQLMREFMYRGELQDVLGDLFAMTSESDWLNLIREVESSDTSFEGINFIKLIDTIRNSKPYNPNQGELNV